MPTPPDDPRAAHVLAAARRCFARGEHGGFDIAREAELPESEAEWWLGLLERSGQVRQFVTDPEAGDPHTYWEPG
jgi:hypothetical protein